MFGVDSHGLIPNIELWCTTYVNQHKKKSIFKNKKTLEPRSEPTDLKPHPGCAAAPLLLRPGHATTALEEVTLPLG
jgi:hypothetical protein